jgi:protein-L-isoaspartate(D-aspartate) O-methyltransferase
MTDAEDPILASLRERMVREQLLARGIRDERLLAAFRQVPRHRFVPEYAWEDAYADRPLPIGEGQTISQPFTVAFMLQSLRLTGTERRALDVGCGSGYAAAVLSRLVPQVFAIERWPSLAKQAAERLQELGYHNIVVTAGDGTLGWPEHAPYDAIVVAAGGPRVPPSLSDQLADGGRLVMPVGESLGDQQMVCWERRGEKIHPHNLGRFAFVPLIGAEGWPGDGRWRE